MKHLFTLMIIFCFVVINTLPAKQVTKPQAKIVAKNFFIEKTGLTEKDLLFGLDFTIANNDETVYYVFNINNGFVIVTANDALFPIIAYSFESNYSGDGFPSGFEFWMENYSKQILYAKINNNKASSAVSAVWKKYFTGNIDPGKTGFSIEPLLSTTWGQGCYYNTALPDEEQGPCGHLYTGCVATAMAQIMKYYNYPESGTGSYGYNTSYGYVEADFENTVFDWEAMENHLTDENEAVALLMYNVTISLNSQFFPEGTGAYDTTVPGALFKYFKYKPDAHFYFRDEYPDDWKALLRSELDEHRPVLYGGVTDENYGHTLVCDGYQDTAFFHFNWGSGGNYNGYFYLDTLIAAGYNFYKWQDAVVGIEPATIGINNHNTPKSVSVYPNPSKGEIFIDFKDYEPDNVEVSLFDLAGKKVFNREFEDKINNYKINVQGLKGMYLMHINSKDKMFFSKISITD